MINQNNPNNIQPTPEFTDGESIVYLGHLPVELSASAGRLFLDAFKDKFAPVFGDGDRAQSVLENSLDPTHCIAAVSNGVLVGLLAIQDSQGSFLNPTLKIMIQTYGMLGGLFRMFGLAVLHHSTASDEFYVEGIAVVDEMRGKGVGSQLLDLLEQLALENGIQTISLAVINTNPRAESLYKRLGFVSTRRDKLWPFNRILGFPFESATFMIKNMG
ncbi:MAG: GNAT family N-acetyltransferase [Chloroflexi bacterium]|nr:GNAT family N-acetyltransferase [Chloroflexota bacterium]